ncbi:MAG: DUF4386 family protein [Chloroflexi bacterium]|nr:DUF4386 family protein [Chloroflexota bacterium]
MTHPIGERRPSVAAAAVLSIVLGIAASILLPAAYGFDIQAIAHPGSIVDKGQGVAELLRWGALLDMASYLPMAVVVVYFHYRLRARNPELITLFTASGLAYVLIGSMAGVLLATVGPPLIEGYATASAGAQDAARVTLEALGNAALIGLWGTLELIFIGFWFIGIGWLMRSDWRRFAVLSTVVGVALLATSLRTGLTGRTLVEINGPLDLVVTAPLGLFFVWELWLAMRLLRGA